MNRERSARWFLRAAAILILSVAGSAASAQGLPASNFSTAPLVTPDEAFTYFDAAGTLHTSSQNMLGTDLRPGRSDEIRTLAVGLGKDDLSAGRINQDEYAKRAFEYVRFNLETTFNFGLTKGAHGALVDQSGSAFDNASLFAELLREAGIGAAYEAGTISLDAEEFGRWTGLVVPTVWNADGSVTSFTVSARGACQLLANGGIPAAINGAGDPSCAGGGNLSSVQLAHVWVAALGRKYDPAYKKQELWKGKDLAVAMQCGSETGETCSSGAQSSAMAGVGRGSFSRSVPWTQNVNANALGSTLTTYAQRLQSAIAAGDKNASREQWIGGTTMAPLGHVSDPMTPIGASVRHSWTEIPDQYRIRFSVQFDNINRSFWADEISAERLRIFGLGSHFVPGTSFTRRTTLYLEFNPLATSFRSGATLSNDNLILTVNYPYAANGGAYQDGVFNRDPWASIVVPHTSSDSEAYVQPITIIHQFGSTRASSIAEAAQVQENSKRKMNLVDPTNTAHDVLFDRGITMSQIPCLKLNLRTKFNVGPGVNYVSDPGCLRLWEPTTVQQILAQDRELQLVAGAVAGGKVTTHHVIGSFGGGAMNLETSRAVAQADGDPASASGLKLASSLLTGWLEGGVSEQNQAEWEGESGLSLLIRSNEKNHRFLQITSANQGIAMGQLPSYSATEKSLIASFTAAGFDVIAPQSSAVGQFDFGCCAHVQYLQNGLGVFKPGYSELGTLVNDGFKGATPGPDDPYDSALKSAKAVMDGFQPQKSFKAGLRDASASLGAFEDIATGAGQFPDRLSFSRIYSSANQVTAVDQAFVTTQDGFAGGTNFSHLVHGGVGAKIGGGWRHNYDIAASMGADGFQGMGIDSAIDASSFLAGLYSLVRLGRTAPSFDTQLTSLFVAHWTGEQLVNNVVNLRTPLVEGTFVRLPDGSFNPPPAVNAKLVQTGQRAGPIPSGAGSAIVYAYSPITFQFIDPTGGSIDFDLAGQALYSINFGQVYTNLRDFKPTRWVFPDGKYVEFQYVRTPWYTQQGQVGEVDCLNRVQNHLGRQLSITFREIGDSDFTRCVIASVSSDAAQSVGYSGIRTGHMNTHLSSPYWAPFTFTVTRIDGSKQYFDYNSTMDNSDASVVDSDIVAWRSDSRTYLTIGYDEFQRLKHVDDAQSQRQSYAVGGLFNEAWKRAGVRDPLGAVTTSILDPQGRPLLDIDPLGFRRSRSYDWTGRLASEVNPEQDSTTYVYDQKSNIILQCKLPKTRLGQPCTSGPDLLSQTSYVEAGPACGNYRICSKPLFAIDAKGHRTDYSWSAVHGLLLSETRGLNAAGACIVSGGCPMTTYGYTAFPGADGSSFYLLTSRTEKIDAATSTVTTFGYNEANRYTLRERVVDSGGANLRTCFAFDSSGNMISKTEPNANLSSCQ